MMGNGDNQKSWWQPGLVLFFRLSGWIGFPIIVALFVGKWLDEKYKSEPWGFLAIMGLAFLISTVGIVIESSKEIKKIEEESRRKKLDDSKDEINKEGGNKK